MFWIYCFFNYSSKEGFNATGNIYRRARLFLRKHLHHKALKSPSIPHGFKPKTLLHLSWIWRVLRNIFDTYHIRKAWLASTTFFEWCRTEFYLLRKTATLRTTYRTKCCYLPLSQPASFKIEVVLMRSIPLIYWTIKQVVGTLDSLLSDYYLCHG